MALAFLRAFTFSFTATRTTCRSLTFFLMALAFLRAFAFSFTATRASRRSLAFFLMTLAFLRAFAFSFTATRTLGLLFSCSRLRLLCSTLTS